MKVVSFFSGCGGLDLGFEQAGFEVIGANDNDPAVSETYLLNHLVGNAVPPRLARAIALSIKSAFSSYSPDLCSVLVATYRNDMQLRMTLENKLYYVRAGLRAGAMQFSLGMKAPHYLFLHKKDSYILLILKEVEPKLVSAEFLENLGFHPSGDQYWTFEILDVEAGERTECMKNYVAKHGGMKMKPYIIEITNIVAKS